MCNDSLDVKSSWHIAFDYLHKQPTLGPRAWVAMLFPDVLHRGQTFLCVRSKEFCG